MINVWNNEITHNDIELLQRAVSNRLIMEGPVLKEFEQNIARLLSVKYAIGTSSGSAALALALMGIGIVPGDEVIVPDLTFIATANAPHMLGARVIVAPVSKNDALLDIDKLDDYVTDKTKAIITVDLNGRIADCKMLRNKYNKRGIYIIDDACQAFMSGGKDCKAGTQADIGCFSFGITKMLTTVQGGAVVTDNPELQEKMSFIKRQGMPSVYEGDEYRYPGFNFKFPDVLAAIGLGQIERLDKKINHMKCIDKMYTEALSELEGIRFLERKNDELLAMTDIVCDNSKYIRMILEDNKILARPLGMPLHTAWYLDKVGDYTEVEEYQKSVLYLPSGPNQDIENVERTIQVLKNNINN